MRRRREPRRYSSGKRDHHCARRAERIPAVSQPAGAAGRFPANQHACLRAGLLRRHRPEQHEGHACQVEGRQRLRYGDRNAGHRRLRRFARSGLRTTDDSAAEHRRHTCFLRRELPRQDGRSIRLFLGQPRGRDRARPERVGVRCRHRGQPRPGGRSQLREVLQLQRRDRRAGEHGGHRRPWRQGDAGTVHRLPRRPGRCADASRRLGQGALQPAPERGLGQSRRRPGTIAAVRGLELPVLHDTRLHAGRARGLPQDDEQMGPVLVPAPRTVDGSGRRLPAPGELRRMARHGCRAHQGGLRGRWPAQPGLRGPVCSLFVGGGWTDLAV